MSSRPNASSAASTIRFGAGEVGDVLSVRDRLAAERLDLAHDVVRRARVGSLPGERRAEVVDEDLGAGTCERERVLAADAASGTRDDCDLPLRLGIT